MATLYPMNALVLAGPADRMARESDTDDSRQRRRRPPPQEPSLVDVDFYNDEAPHELDELA